MKRCEDGATGPAIREIGPRLFWLLLAVCGRHLESIVHPSMSLWSA